ncbi:MAG TPA: hypothetical protein VK203_15485 [Nostocaceae cyanobacterium]|nr:hypothetical protein [Nostocaceae cyanobacterium]
MKSIKIPNIVVILIVTISAFLAGSNSALADYLSSEGSGGRYYYQLWSSDDSSYYYLKIWLLEQDPKSRPYTQTRSFRSSSEALDYFDCNYADKSLPNCPR